MGNPTAPFLEIWAFLKHAKKLAALRNQSEAIKNLAGYFTSIAEGSLPVKLIKTPAFETLAQGSAVQEDSEDSDGEEDQLMKDLEEEERVIVATVKVLNDPSVSTVCYNLLCFFFL